MTSQQFLTACQEYYGLAYSPGQGKIVERYLDTLSMKLKDYVFAEVLKVHSATFKSLPDVAIIESVIPRAVESRDESMAAKLVITHDDGPLATPEQIEEFNADMQKLGIKWRAQSPMTSRGGRA